MVSKTRVLLVGLDPDIVDYSKSPVPGLTAAKVRAAVHRYAPASTKICFNTNPSDTADAVRRWV
jgi:hypothetical protein